VDRAAPRVSSVHSGLVEEIRPTPRGAGARIGDAVMRGPVAGDHAKSRAGSRHPLRNNMTVTLAR
jgi:hypothetical protein